MGLCMSDFRYFQRKMLTSVTHGDDLEYIRMCATPPTTLVFWDGALSPYKYRF